MLDLTMLHIFSVGSKSADAQSLSITVSSKFGPNFPLSFCQLDFLVTLVSLRLLGFSSMKEVKARVVPSSNPYSCFGHGCASGSEWYCQETSHSIVQFSRLSFVGNRGMEQSVRKYYKKSWLIISSSITTAATKHRQLHQSSILLCIGRR